MIIGITGSIGSGKTTAAKMFSRHHYDRIDADEIAHEIIDQNKIVYEKIINEFGSKILNKNKIIDRKKLGNVIFNDANKIKRLNSITHPIIISEIRNQIKKIKNECGKNAKIIVDAPLLLETNAKDLIDRIIVVRTSKENILKRLGEKHSKRQIERILKHQMSLEEKLKHADFVIDNNKNFSHMEKQITEIIKNL